MLLQLYTQTLTSRCINADPFGSLTSHFAARALCSPVPSGRSSPSTDSPEVPPRSPGSRAFVKPIPIGVPLRFYRHHLLAHPSSDSRQTLEGYTWDGLQQRAPALTLHRSGDALVPERDPDGEF